MHVLLGQQRFIPEAHHDYTDIVAALQIQCILHLQPKYIHPLSDSDSLDAYEDPASESAISQGTSGVVAAMEDGTVLQTPFCSQTVEQLLRPG